jgi:hypothetical protein
MTVNLYFITFFLLKHVVLGSLGVTRFQDIERLFNCKQEANVRYCCQLVVCLEN